MDANDVRIAIVQDRLTVPGGGEKVVHQISKLFDSVVYTGEYRPNSTYDFSHTEVTEIGGNKFAEFAKLRNRIEWKNFDIAIFSGNRPQFTLWKSLPIPTIRYCHSPARKFWSLRDRDFREASPWGKCLRTVVAPTFRLLDQYVSSNHDLILTNSSNIRSQVDRFYGLDAEVLYPPVDTGEYRFEESGDFWMSVNRLVPKKRVKEQISAFCGTEEELVIVGEIDHKFQSYGEEAKALASESENIHIEGFVSDSELKSLYSKCKGVIYLPHFEDFGIVPIEAMASGKPVIAAAEGGTLETVIDGQSGWLIKPTSKNIQDVITTSFDEDEFREQSQAWVSRFDSSEFVTSLSSHVNRILDRS
jgi:glycosyltransferase involved in cell wall biosynthesis